MATNDFNWGSIFDRPEEEAAIPEFSTPQVRTSQTAKAPVTQTPVTPQQPFDWGSIFTPLVKSQPPSQAIPEVPTGSHKLRGAWELAKQVPSIIADVVPLTAGRALRGALRGGRADLDPTDWLDSWIEENKAERARRSKMLPEVGEMTWFRMPFTGEDVKINDTIAIADSLGYSIVNALAAQGAKYVGGAVGTAASGGNPIVGRISGLAAGFGAGVAISGLATKDQFIDDMQTVFMNAHKVTEITPELEAQWSSIFDEIQRDANLFGFWEAAPETLGNMLTWGIANAGKGKIASAVFAKMKDKLTKKITGKIGKAAAAAAAKAGIGIAKLGAAWTEEALTETLTAKMQSRIEAKHGLAEKELTWEEAITEVLPMVFVTTPLMLGGAKLAGVLVDGNVLSDANPDTPKKMPGEVKDKTDAKTILEIAGARMLEEQTAEAEATQIVSDKLVAEEAQAIPDPSVQAAQAMGGVPGVVIDDVVVDKIVDTLDEVHAGPSYKERVEAGDITRIAARAEHEEEFMTKPETRPAWASTRRQISKPKTDADLARQIELRKEARTAFDKVMGEDVTTESQPVSEYKTFLQESGLKFDQEDYSKKYGKDFVKQVDNKKLNPIQKVWQKVVQTLYGRDVFYVEYNKAVNDDPDNTLTRRKGARIVQSGAIVIVKGDPIRNTETVFHELTHDMNRTAPEIWKKLHKFLIDNGDNDYIKDMKEELKESYLDNKSVQADELVAKFVGKLMREGEAQVSLLNKLKKQDPTAFTQIMTYVQKALQKLLNFLKGSDQSAARLLVKDVDAAIEFVTNMLAEFQTVARVSQVGKTVAEMQRIQEEDLTFDIEITESAKKEVKYFSEMNRYLEKNLPGKGGGKQYIQLINRWNEKGAFKTEELEWSGLIEYLDDPKYRASYDVEGPLTNAEKQAALVEALKRGGRSDPEYKRILSTVVADEDIPKASNIITKKQIMKYLKENEVSIGEVHKVELSRMPDFDLPQAVEDRQRLIIKIQHAIQGEPITLLMDATNVYDAFEIDSTGERVVFSSAYETLTNMGASANYAASIVSDINTLTGIDAEIKKVQDIADPESSKKLWEHRLMTLQTTLKDDYKLIVRVEDVDPEGTWGETGNLQVVSLVNTDNGKTVEIEDDDPANKIIDSINETLDEIYRLSQMDPLIPTQYGPAISEGLTIGGGTGYSELLLTLPLVTPKFMHGHWKTTENVVAMVRFDFRIVDGKKVLLIQELQSDWHQTGRKKGYIPRGFKKITELPEGSRVDTIEGGLPGRQMTYYKVTLPDGKTYEAGDRDSAIQNAINSYNMEFGGKVTDAPYKKTWSDLVLKRMVKMAAELGQDYLAWVPAEVIQDRYNLTNVINEVMYSPDDQMFYAYDKNDEEVFNEAAGSEADIAEFIGGELAKRLWDEVDNFEYMKTQYEIHKEDGHDFKSEWYITDPNGETFYDQHGDEHTFEHKHQAEDFLEEMHSNELERNPISLKGVDLEVGGEWAVNLYDKKLKNRANKLFGKKAWGKPKVFQDVIPTADYPEIEFDVRVNGEVPTVAGSTSLMNWELAKADRTLIEYLIEMEGEDIDQIYLEWVFEADGNTPKTWGSDSAGNIGLAIATWLGHSRRADERGEFKLEYLPHEKKVWLLPITQKMKDKIPGTETMTFDIEEDVGAPVTVTSDTAKKGYFELDLDDGISGDDFNRHLREKRLGYKEPSKDWLESGRIIRNIWGTFDKKDTNNSIALKALSSVALGADVRISEKDHGAISIIESMGFKKVDKTTYRLDERIPENAEIIAGMYQASWHIDLESDRASADLLSKISKSISLKEGRAVGPKEPVGLEEKLQKYINRSWPTYNVAADHTSNGDLNPTKNVLLRPPSVKSGKGRQLLIQISSDFKSEGSTNIGDSYYEALYSKREGYLRPSNDFWELPEWMNRMTHFLPDADIYVIRNLKEAKLFLNQAKYDNVFFSVLDITKKFVKEVADTYTGNIIAGGYLPDGSYYKGMKNVTWVGDMKEAAEKLGVEFKNGVDYRYFKNTKTIPRLEMSKGCLHKCAFCSQDRFLTLSSTEDIKQQIAEYKAFDYEIVYLNDKTFGQAKNYPDLVNIKQDLKKANPNFKGFVIQTTATQYLKMSDEFLTNAGIVYLEIGVETFNDKMLSLLDKPHREKHILEAAAKARRLNQVFVPNVMVGLASKDKSGKIIVETEATYARTLKFLNDNKDIISHTNIGVLAAESGTKLHQQLDAVESDQDEFHTERTWLKNVDIHEKFFADLSAFGEAQLDSEDVAAYVKGSMAINAGAGSVATIKEAEDKKFDALQAMMPDGVKLDALGEEYTTTPLGMMQVTVIDKKSPAAGGSFNVKIGNKDVIAKDVARAIEEYVELRKGVLKDLRERMTEDIEAPIVEGDRQSATFRYAYYGIFDLARKAKGMKNVRKYLERNKKLGDEPITEELIKNIGNVADRLSKDKKKAAAFKKVVKMREDLATGKKLANDPKTIREMEGIPNLQPYTIRYTAPNFAIGQRMRYGKFLASDALFDADREITRETALKFRNPITGNMESVTKQYDAEGNRLISGPIFSPDRKTRLQEIKKIVLKNKRYSTWYEDWKKFMFQFVSDDMSEMKIKRIAAISGMLGAGKSPQTQQQLWAETINSLESGHRPTKVAKNELEKMMEIWEGKKDDILSRTDDEGIQLIQQEFGRKIGPYLAAAIDPSSPNVLVLDRHMPKGWGYNVLASSSSPQGGWNMHPSVESEVRRDIYQVSEEMGVTVAGVQAALWFDFRTPAADQSDIAKIAQIEPSRYVPSVFHKTTDPDVTIGIHYKKTDVPEGEFVRGSSAKGDIAFNTYSQTDIGERISRGTKEWPYQSAVYMYQPGMKVEMPIKTGRKAYTFKYDPRTIYDGVNDPYNYWGTARDELKKSPRASLTNIFLKLVSAREQYQGAVVRSPFKPKEDQWMMIFDKAEVTDFPEVTNVGISDMLDDIDTTYSDFKDALIDMGVRGQKFAAFTKSVQSQKKYSELTIDRHYPSVARFEGVTSGEIELGLGLKLDGPLRSQRAYLAEVGISRNQRYVYLAHSPRKEVNYPDFTNFSEAKLFSFKAKNEYNKDIVRLAKDLEAAGLKDFNVVASPAGWSIIEQITFDDKNATQMADIIEKFADKDHPHNDVRDIHSETLGGDTMEDALENYSSAIIDYWGDKKGREIIDGAIREGKTFERSVRSGAYQKGIDDKARGRKPRTDKGIQDDLGATEDVEESVAFKKWFKGSKVTDIKGNPMVVYHGTVPTDEFEAFYPFSHFGTAEAAEEILQIRRGDPEDLATVYDLPIVEGERVYPVYLSIKNPIRIEDSGAESLVSDLLGSAVAQKVLTKDESDIAWGNFEANPNIDSAYSELADLFELKGFDGAVYENAIEDAGYDSWMVFRPNQIKSVYSKKFSSSDVMTEDVEVEDQLDRIGRTKIGTIEKVRRSAHYEKGTFTTASSDYLHPLKMAAGEESKAYMLHRGLPGIQSSINAMMEHGILDLEDSGVLTTATRKKGFIPWLRKLGKDGEKFFYWLIVKRDQSRQKRDKKYIPMFTKEERDKLFAWTGDRTVAGKNWQEVNKEFQVFNDSILKIGIKSGLLDPAMVAQFKDQFYIPFYRIFEDAESTAEFIKAPVNTKKLISAQIKKLHGTKRQMGDPLENIMTNWAHLIKQSMTNLSRKEAFEYLTEIGAVNEMGELIVEEVPWKDTVIFKPGGKRMNDYGGADTVTFIYQKDNIEVLGFKDNGKTKFFKVNDAELFNAMSLQNTKSMPKWLSMILGAPKALLTFGATVTPGFVVANTLRDTLHTYTIADGFIPFISTAKGFYKTLLKDQDYVEYMASGNSFVGSYVKAESAEEFNKYTKKIIAKEGRSVLRRILTSPAQLWNLWRTITEASENAARLELYALKKRQGATKLEASFAARDIMDFQKKGASAVVQYLTLTVPFLNARIQGLVKMGQAAAARPGMYALKGATIAIASLALWAAYKDDPRYIELEEWEKFAYYHFWIGDKHFRIPKPFETGVIWSSAFTAAADVAVKNEEADHIMSFIGTSMLDTFAFNPMPQAAKPLFEQYMNKNFFTDRPIVPESMKYKQPSDRYSPWDHESMIALGKLLNVSPKRAQALVRGYLAGLGTGIMAGADIMVRQFGDFPARPESTIDSYPMIGRFIRSTPSRYTKFQSSFYEVFNQLNELNQTIRIAQRDGRYVEAAELRKLNNKKMLAFGRGKIVKNKLAIIRKKMNNIWLDKIMDPKRKLLDLNKLTIERNEIVKEFYIWYLSNK